MDRFAANTLRTLGIIFISIFVIGASLILLLFALCLGALGSSGGMIRNPSEQRILFLCIVVAAFLIVVGVVSIAKLSRGIVRSTPEYAYVPAPAAGAPLTNVPQAPLPQISRARLEQGPAPSFEVAKHFSSASRHAIHQLVWAICAKLAAELLLVIPAGIAASRLRPAPQVNLSYTPLTWTIAAVAPLIVLLYALLRHPGPRAFAYSLVIPVIHIFFGSVGDSATIVFLFARHPGFSPFLSLFSLLPWLLDILILYLAWKAIRLTGIHPNSTRLIVAAAVIFIYSSLIPILAVAMYAFWHHT